MPDLDLPADGEKPYGTKLRTAIETLNTAHDDLEGSLGGGTTGQVLKKSSDVDHEYEWADDLSVAPGSANNPHTDANAPRNNALQKNFWQTSTEPVNWLDGDEWIEIA